MKDLLILMKKDFQVFINGFNKKTKNKKRGSSNIVLPIFTFLFISLMAAIYVGSMMATAQPINKEGTIFEIVVLFALFFSLTTSISRSRDILFSNKDFDFLMALPINRNTIVLSKLLNLYLVNMYFSLAYLIPAIILYQVFAGFNAIYILTFIVSIPFMNLLMIAIGSLFGWILSILTSLFKNGKLVYTIVMCIIFAGFIGFITYITYGKDSNTNPSEEISKEQAKEELLKSFNSMDEVLKYFFPSHFLAQGILGNWLYILFMILINVFPFALFVVIFARSYLSAMSIANKKYKNLNYKLDSKKEKTNSPKMAIAKKEIRYTFSNVAVAMNTLTGPLIGMVGMIVLIFIKDKFMISFEENGIIYEMDLSLIICLCLALFFNSMVSYTSSSISLEGKNFWLLKSSPLEAKEILLGKLYGALIMQAPFILVQCIALLFVSNFNILFSLIMFVLIPLIAVMDGLLGLIVNVRWPKFSFDNVIEVVKQGKSVGLSILFGMIYIIFALTIAFISSFILSPVFAALFVLIITIILTVIYYAIFKNKTVKRFDKISD